MVLRTVDPSDLGATRSQEPNEANGLSGSSNIAFKMRGVLRPRSPRRGTKVVRKLFSILRRTIWRSAAAETGVQTTGVTEMDENRIEGAARNIGGKIED